MKTCCETDKGLLEGWIFDGVLQGILQMKGDFKNAFERVVLGVHLSSWSASKSMVRGTNSGVWVNADEEGCLLMGESARPGLRSSGSGRGTTRCTARI